MKFWTLLTLSLLSFGFGQADEMDHLGNNYGDSSIEGQIGPRFGSGLDKLVRTEKWHIDELVASGSFWVNDISQKSQYPLVTLADGVATGGAFGGKGVMSDTIGPVARSLSESADEERDLWFVGSTADGEDARKTVEPWIHGFDVTKGSKGRNVSLSYSMTDRDSSNGSSEFVSRIWGSFGDDNDEVFSTPWNDERDSKLAKAFSGK